MKRFISVFLCIFMLIGLVACGESESQTESSKTAGNVVQTTEEKTTEAKTTEEPTTEEPTTEADSSVSFWEWIQSEKPIILCTSISKKDAFGDFYVLQNGKIFYYPNVCDYGYKDIKDLTDEEVVDLLKEACEKETDLSNFGFNTTTRYTYEDGDIEGHGYGNHGYYAPIENYIYYSDAVRAWTLDEKFMDAFCWLDINDNNNYILVISSDSTGNYINRIKFCSKISPFAKNEDGDYVMMYENTLNSQLFEGLDGCVRIEPEALAYFPAHSQCYYSMEVYDVEMKGYCEFYDKNYYEMSINYDNVVVISDTQVPEQFTADSPGLSVGDKIDYSRDGIDYYVDLSDEEIVEILYDGVSGE